MSFLAVLIDEASFKTETRTNDDYLIMDAITFIMRSNLNHAFLRFRLTNLKAVIAKDSKTKNNNVMSRL